jgi:hypothetical protein
VTTDPDLDEVVRRELLLLDPTRRAAPDDVSALLHPDFREHGASGRVWDRGAIVAALATDPAVTGDAVDLAPIALAPDVILLTYRITSPTSDGSIRSSVWVRDVDGEWLLRFHQGTRTRP